MEEEEPSKRRHRHKRIRRVKKLRRVRVGESSSNIGSEILCESRNVKRIETSESDGSKGSEMFDTTRREGSTDMSDSRRSEISEISELFENRKRVHTSENNMNKDSDVSGFIGDEKKSDIGGIKMNNSSKASDVNKDEKKTNTNKKRSYRDSNGSDMTNGDKSVDISKDSDASSVAKRRSRTKEKNKTEHRDKDLDVHFLNFSGDNVMLPDVVKSISEHWFDLKKEKRRGFAGFLLATEISKVEDKLINEKSLGEVYDQLDTVRTTIKDVNEALLFYLSSLSLYQYTNTNKKVKNFSKKLVRKSIETYSDLELRRVIPIIKKVVDIDHVEPSILELSNEFLKIKERYKTDSELFLYKNIMNRLDCSLSNLVVKDNFMRTIEEVVRANTNISRFVANISDDLPIFRQVLLLFIAYEQILDNPDSYEDLVPLIPPNIGYLLFCSLRVDMNVHEPIEYELIDRFATEKNCDLATDFHEFQFRTEAYELPEKCSDLEF